MKEKFPSRYSPDRLVTPIQYTAENMCECIAKAEKVDLPTKFWEDAKWAKLYVREITFCNRLVKKGYYPRAIILALRDRKCFGIKMMIWFEKIDRFKKILDKHQAIVKLKIAKEKKPEVTKGADVTQKPKRPVSSRRSKISKLRGL